MTRVDDELTAGYVERRFGNYRSKIQVDPEGSRLLQEFKVKLKQAANKNSDKPKKEDVLSSTTGTYGHYIGH